jgi:hypothetical protein
MITRSDLHDWVEEALRTAGGETTVVEVARRIWAKHEPELRSGGDLFYTWQYDMRWAAMVLESAALSRLLDLTLRCLGVGSAL